MDFAQATLRHVVTQVCRPNRHATGNAMPDVWSTSTDE